VTIAVVSPKGGLGKTSTTALLGSLLARVRHERMVAVDTNPDYGSLGRASRRTTASSWTTWSTCSTTPT